MLPSSGRAMAYRIPLALSRAAFSYTHIHASLLSFRQPPSSPLRNAHHNSLAGGHPRAVYWPRNYSSRETVPLTGQTFPNRRRWVAPSPTTRCAAEPNSSTTQHAPHHPAILPSCHRDAVRASVGHPPPFALRFRGWGRAGGGSATGGFVLPPV